MIYESNILGTHFSIFAFFVMLQNRMLFVINFLLLFVGKIGTNYPARSFLSWNDCLLLCSDYCCSSLWFHSDAEPQLLVLPSRSWGAAGSSCFCCSLEIHREVERLFAANWSLTMLWAELQMDSDSWLHYSAIHQEVFGCFLFFPCFSHHKNKHLMYAFNCCCTLLAEPTTLQKKQ